MTEHIDQALSESVEEWKDRYHKLKAENAYLQSRVTRFASVEQDLITAKHLIDLERRRFERMREFIRKGVRAETAEECVQLVGDGIVDILECEIGIVLLKAQQGNAEVFYVSHPKEDGWVARVELRDWFSHWMANSQKGSSLMADALGFNDLLIHEVVDDDADRIGVMIAANSSSGADFHDCFSPSANEAFLAFASQVGAILGSLARRDTIAAQVERIRLSEERLSLALASSNVGLWDWDLLNGDVHYSEQWKRMIGYSGDEITDHFDEWESRLHPSERETVVKTAEFCSKQIGASPERTFRLRHRSGSWRWILAKGFTIAGIEGEPVRVVGTHIDVTSYKRLENRLRRSESSQRRAKEDALKQSRAKSTFLANVSHEIRTPLNGILGAYEILKELPQTETGLELVTMGQQSAQWMLDIIGESLDLAKIEAGKIELSEGAFDLVKMIFSLADIKRIKAANKGLAFDVRISSSLPQWVIGDRSKVLQILTNLIGNAIKFTDHGGVGVIVDHKPAHDPGLIHVRFEITDSGIGVPAHSLDDVFLPFHQADQTMTRRFGGVGLGLAIVRNLTNLMKGRIRLRPSKSGGSVFCVTLPFRLASTAPQATEDGSPKVISFRGRVLLAEDDKVSRLLAVRMLEQLGFEVTPAENGAIALELFRPGRFDLVVLDCWMPQVNGAEVSVRIRESERFTSGRVPILAVTANVQSSAVIECLQAGMDEFLGKPIRLEALADAVLRLLPQALVAD